MSRALWCDGSSAVQCSAAGKNSKETHLVFLLAASFNVLRHFLPAQTHAAAAVLLDLAYGGAQLGGVCFESLHLQLAHDRCLRSRHYHEGKRVHKEALTSSDSSRCRDLLCFNLDSHALCFFKKLFTSRSFVI